MQVGQRLNLRADVIPLEPEMVLTAINTFGGAATDRARLLDAFSALMPVGFYYKAFLDKQLFPTWERLIRLMTGLGKLDFETPHIRTAKRYDFCDLLVIGGGVSGLSAALTAADTGADVVLVDENARLGGSGGYQLGGELPDATYKLVEAVAQHPHIRIYYETEAAGYYADHWVPLVERQRLTKMRAINLATIVNASANAQNSLSAR